MAQQSMRSARARFIKDASKELGSMFDQAFASMGGGTATGTTRGRTKTATPRGKAKGTTRRRTNAATSGNKPRRGRRPASEASGAGAE
jgi:hypothetical protein